MPGKHKKGTDNIQIWCDKEKKIAIQKIARLHNITVTELFKRYMDYLIKKHASEKIILSGNSHGDDFEMGR